MLRIETYPRALFVKLRHVGEAWAELQRPRWGIEKRPGELLVHAGPLYLALAAASYPRRAPART